MTKKEAQLALANLKRYMSGGGAVDRGTNKAIDMAIEALKEPQIIRCKDCKHWIPYDWMFSEMWQSKNIADYPEDEIGCNLCDMAMKSNDFCSRAERRTE